jgi:hypothetical protein
MDAPALPVGTASCLRPPWGERGEGRGARSGWYAAIRADALRSKVTDVRVRLRLASEAKASLRRAGASSRMGLESS